MGKFRLFAIVSLIIVFLDLLTKGIAVKALSEKDIVLIPNFLDLTLVWNKGAAFGTFAQSPEWIRKLILLGASTVAALATTIYAYIKRHEISTLEAIFLALITGGAVGNLYDRFILGKVRDFIDAHVFSYHWPAFNIADASITIGILGFILNELYFKKKLKSKDSDKI